MDVHDAPCSGTWSHWMHQESWSCKTLQGKIQCCRPKESADRQILRGKVNEGELGTWDGHGQTWACEGEQPRRTIRGLKAKSTRSLKPTSADCGGTSAQQMCHSRYVSRLLLFQRQTRSSCHHTCIAGADSWTDVTVWGAAGLLTKGSWHCTLNIQISFYLDSRCNLDLFLIHFEQSELHVDFRWFSTICPSAEVFGFFREIRMFSHPTQVSQNHSRVETNQLE